MSASTLAKTYDPASVEQRCYANWEKHGYFTPGEKNNRASYCLMIPPPNVTGSLHMGHAFQDTIMDALIRHRRMKGEQTLWQTGTDHAGIATQMVVERQLAALGQTRHDLGRDRFIDRVWQWKQTSGGTIVQQLRRMGASCDWSRERFTMDPELSRAVREVFVKLYAEGLIYRGKRLVNWDPVLHTAVSDLEVLSAEEDGHMWHIRYPLTNGQGMLVVATTRPETMLGDSAVAVHPDDERYRHWIGQEVDLPLTGRRIPVIADPYVDPEFGSGCVKITPAHDFNDYEVGQRHHLPLLNIFTIHAAINENGPEAYRGLDRYVARKKILADLDEQGLLAKTEPHRLTIPRGDRSKAIIEPFLTDQWFVKTESLAAEAIQAVADGRIRFVPATWEKTYFEWMRNIQDWCISRQIWWGHRIPAWYGPDGHFFVANDAREAAKLAQEHYGHEVTLTQDADVLDTWFSSALWPFSTLGWPDKTQELQDFYPTQVLVTGFDIIFFWVARMIMMGLKFTGDVPFRDVYITGLVRDSEGQKMSKSKGNILDPLDLIDGIDLESLVEKRTRDMMQPHLAKKIAADTRKEFPQGIPTFGADALRFTMASLATQGRDIKFDLNRVDGYRNFCNKLWNATRFVLMNAEGKDCYAEETARTFSVPDRWILSLVQQAKKAMESALQEYRFNEAAHVIYQFLWGSYCDWYLEMIKPVLYGDLVSEPQKAATRWTMIRVLEESLRLLHPLMPFITEELWLKVAPLAGQTGATIMLAPWPEPEPRFYATDVEQEMAWVIAFVSTIRTIRGKMNLPPGKQLPILVAGEAKAIQRLRRYEGLIAVLAKLSGWKRIEGDPPDGCATGVMDDIRLFIPLADLMDLDAETQRLEKNLQELHQDLERIQRKLGNTDFLAKAKAEIIEKERTKENALLEKRHGLDEALRKIAHMRRLP